MRESFNADETNPQAEPPIDLIADVVHGLLMLPHHLNRIATALEVIASPRKSLI